jgi:hypothetical protein
MNYRGAQLILQGWSAGSREGLAQSGGALAIDIPTASAGSGALRALPIRSAYPLISWILNGGGGTFGQRSPSVRYRRLCASRQRAVPSAAAQKLASRVISSTTVAWVLGFPLALAFVATLGR